MKILLSADNWLFTYLQHYVGKYAWLDEFYVIVATWFIYIIPLVLIAAWFWSAQTKRVALRSTIAGLIAWEGISKIIAMIAHRARPSESLVGVKELMFHRQDVSFPSDHMALIFAIAVSVRLAGHKKLGNFLLVLGTLIGLARIMVRVHFPLDIITGAVIGTVTALVVWRFRNFIDKFLTDPIINLFKKIHL